MGEALGGVLIWCGAWAGLVLEDLSDHGAEVAAGEGVIADEGDAVGGEETAAEGQESVGYVLGDPGVDAVGDDVVEEAEVWVGVLEGEDIGLEEVDVGEAELLDALVAASDGLGGQVKADEVAGGDGVGHGDEVAAFVAADFEDPAMGDGGGVRPWRRAWTARLSGWVAG